MAHPYLDALQAQLEAWQKVKEVSGDDKDAKQAEFADLINQAGWWQKASSGRAEEWKKQEADLAAAAKAAGEARKNAEAEGEKLPDLRELKKALSEARKTLKAATRPQKGNEEDLSEKVAELQKEVDELMGSLSDSEQALVKETGDVKELIREIRKAQRGSKEGKILKALDRMGGDLKDLVGRLEKSLQRQKDLTKTAPKGKAGKEIRDAFKASQAKLEEALKASQEARETYKGAVKNHPVYQAGEEAEQKQQTLKSLGKALKDLDRLQKRQGNTSKGEEIDPKAAAKAYEAALEALREAEAAHAAHADRLNHLPAEEDLQTQAAAAKEAARDENAQLKALKTTADKAAKKYKSLFGADAPAGEANGPLLSALYRHSDPSYWTISNEEMDKLAQVIGKMFPGGNPLTLLLKSIELNHKLLISDSLSEHEKWAQSARDALLEGLGLNEASLPRKATFGKQLQFIIGALAGLVEDPSLQNAVQKAEDILKLRSSQRRSLEGAIVGTDQAREAILSAQAADVILNQFFAQLEERKKTKEISAAKLKALKELLTPDHLLQLASGGDLAPSLSKQVRETSDHELVVALMEDLGAGEQLDNRSIRIVEKVVSDFKKDYFHLEFEPNWLEPENQADKDAGVRILSLGGSDAKSARKKLEKVLEGEVGKDYATKWNIRFAE